MIEVINLYDRRCFLHDEFQKLICFSNTFVLHIILLFATFKLIDVLIN